MKRAKIIQLNKKKIIFCDLKGIEREEILQVSQQTWSLFGKHLPQNEKANFLVDMTGVEIPPKIMEEIVHMAERYKQNIDKEGVIGLHGFRKTLLNFYGWVIGSNLKAFENRDRAMHWLAS